MEKLFFSPAGTTSCITGGEAQRNRRIKPLPSFKPR
jgi:hypothetical protein